MKGKLLHDLQSFLSGNKRPQPSSYLDIDAPNEREGRIQARQLVEANTDFNIEFITPLSEQHLAYEKESGAFELTEY